MCCSVWYGVPLGGVRIWHKKTERGPHGVYASPSKSHQGTYSIPLLIPRGCRQETVSFNDHSHTSSYCTSSSFWKHLIAKAKWRGFDHGWTNMWRVRENCASLKMVSGYEQVVFSWVFLKLIWKLMDSSKWCRKNKAFRCHNEGFRGIVWRNQKPFNTSLDFETTPLKGTDVITTGCGTWLWPHWQQGVLELFMGGLHRSTRHWCLPNQNYFKRYVLNFFCFT